MFIITVVVDKNGDFDWPVKSASHSPDFISANTPSDSTPTSHSDW